MNGPITPQNDDQIGGVCAILVPRIEGKSYRTKGGEAFLVRSRSQKDYRLHAQQTLSAEFVSAVIRGVRNTAWSDSRLRHDRRADACRITLVDASTWARNADFQPRARKKRKAVARVGRRNPQAGDSGRQPDRSVRRKSR